MCVECTLYIVIRLQCDLVWSGVDIAYTGRHIILYEGSPNQNNAKHVFTIILLLYKVIKRIYSSNIVHLHK